MDYEKLKQNIINMLAIHFEQTGHEEMEIAEIASHLKMSGEHVEKAIDSLVEAGIVGKSMNERNATLLRKEYAEKR